MCPYHYAISRGKGVYLGRSIRHRGNIICAVTHAIDALSNNQHTEPVASGKTTYEILNRSNSLFNWKEGIRSVTEDLLHG